MIKRHIQQGISLLEMMISLSIGVLLLLGLGAIYQVANQVNRDNQVLSDNAEAARQVFNRLDYDLRRAGFVDLYDTPVRAFAGAASRLGISCPTGSYVTGKHPLNERYGSVLANKKELDMGTIYLRWKPDSSSSTTSSSTTPTMAEVNRAFMAPISYISCGTIRPVFGCENAIDANPDIDVLSACTNNSDVLSNSIEIAYQGVKTNPTNFLSSLDTSEEDCGYENIAGSTARLEKTNGFVINSYFLKKDDKNHDEMSFACRGNATGAAKILVPGVQEMVFRYVTTVPERDSGKTLTESNSGSVVTAYKTATEVDGSELGWSGVVGVEVCLVISSASLNGAKNASLAAAQGDERPTCERDRSGSGEFAKNVPKGDENNSRFYERYVRTFSLPNGLYAPIN